MRYVFGAHHELLLDCFLQRDVFDNCWNDMHFSQYACGCYFQQSIPKVLDVRFHPGGEPLLAVSCNEVRQTFFKCYI